MWAVMADFLRFPRHVPAIYLYVYVCQFFFFHSAKVVLYGEVITITVSGGKVPGYKSELCHSQVCGFGPLISPSCSVCQSVKWYNSTYLMDLLEN